MKKKTICMFLAFLLAFAGSIPAYAAVSANDMEIVEIGNVDGLLERTAEGVPEGCVPLTESEMAMFCEPVNVEGDLAFSAEDAIPYDLRHRVYTVETSVYPLGVNRDTYQGFYHTGIGHSITYTTYYQMAALMLTNEETMQLMLDMSNFLDTQEGDYGLAGWAVYTKIYFQAEYPRSATITPSETCILDPEPISFSIPYKQATYSLTRVFSYPQDKNVFKDVYTIGFDGMFTFKDTAGGAERSLPFSSDVMFNVPK